jgi:predicted RNase H-like nuclease (RuvC/YqgF family)
MRESLYIQRLWNAFMRKKMEKEMKESASIDEAFKAIKTTTGVTDVQEMVRKFLTREQTYSQLLMNVSESERHIDKLKKDNEELRGRLHELKIDAGESGAGGSNGAMMDEEIIELNSQLQAAQKDYGLLQEKFKKINIVNDQISGWAKKCYSKFSTLIGTGDLGGAATGQLDIVTLFKGMNKVVTTEVDKIAEKQRQNQSAGEDVQMNFNEVFDDFEHKDFTAKNVRVRPISGFTHGDETRDGRQSNISKGNTEGNDEGEDNYNKFAVLELEDQRKAIKTKHREALDEIRRKQALAAKEAEAKKAKQ